MADIEAYDFIRLGTGVDPVRAVGCGDAVDWNDTTNGPSSTNSVTGQKVYWSLTVKKNTKDVLTMLDVTGSLSSKVSGIQGGIRSEYMQEMSQSTFNTYIMATCRVENPPQFITGCSLKPDASDLANKNLDEFENRYGTHFVSGLIAGGYYAGIIEVESTSSEVQEAIDLAVSGEGWGTSADIKVASKLNQITSDYKTVVRGFRIGASGGTLAVSIDDMISAVVNFPAAVAAAPSLLGATLLPYSALPNMPTGSVMSYVRQDDYSSLTDQYIQLCEYKSNIEFVIENYDEQNIKFNYQGTKPTKQAYNDALTGVTTQRDVVITNMDANRNARPYTVPAAYDLQVELPQIEGDSMFSVPANTIILWTGTQDSIPNGYAVCDGTSGTPDLRDRFIVGAGSSYKPKDSGDGDTHVHSVSGTASDVEGHTHGFGANWYGRGLASGGNSGIDINNDLNKLTDHSGGHNHNVTAESSTASVLRPKWYALLYIMKKPSSFAVSS